MHDFVRHFFGAGTEVEFRNFTLAHFLPILVLLGVIFLIWRFREKLGGCEKERYFRYALAFLLIFSEISSPSSTVRRSL